MPVRLLFPALAMLLLLAGCADTRIERYRPLDEAPQALTDGVAVRIPYYKQSQRHFYALLRIDNSGDKPLLLTRNGPQRTAATITAEGRSQPAEPPLRTSWSVWTGTIDHAPGSTDDGVGETITQRIEPGDFAELSVRWEFSSTLTTHDYPWTIAISGLVRDGQAIPPITVISPSEH